MAGRAPRPPGVIGSSPGVPMPASPSWRRASTSASASACSSGALRALSSAGLPDEAVEVHWVPGSFELPQAAACLARTGRFEAIVCVGCVIKGETPHFDFVAGQAAAGIQRVALDTGLPVTFGVITALTEEQAWARAGGAVGNRGQEAAEAAVEMAAFVREHGARRGEGGRDGHGRQRRGAGK